LREADQKVEQWHESLLGLSSVFSYNVTKSVNACASALRDLQPEAKVVFLLRQNSSLAYEEIARMLRCPVDTVKARMRLALRDLRKVLNKR
jgi:DNA-directed RNA polymerase specialized sigma24 family protein